MIDRTNGFFKYLLLLSAGLVASACSSEPEKQSTGAGGSTSSSSASSASSGGSGGMGGGSGGSGGAGGSSAGACAKALFCDDFESHAAQMEPGGAWTVQKSAAGAAAVDTTRAASGKQSVKIGTTAGPGYKSALIGYGEKLPLQSNVVYGRMMFWLEAAPTNSVHWTFITGRGKVPGQVYSAEYRYGGQQPISENGTFVGSQLMANYETPDFYQTPPVGPGTDCWFHADKKVVPVGKWACAEWKFDGPKNEMSFWLDGVELPDLHMQGKGQGCVNQPVDYPWTAPTFDKILVGWESYQDDEARTIWIDDVVISEEPIGCPN